MCQKLGWRFLIAMTLLISASTTTLAQLPENYLSLSAEDKKNILWKNIEDGAWQEIPPLSGAGWSSICSALQNLAKLGKTFSLNVDELSEEKSKIIHAFGSVATFKMEQVENKYSGLFASGGIGILRFSLAGNPEAIGSFNPGMAMKFLIDGAPSRNLVVMNSLDGQANNRNWFALPFSHIIPQPTKTFLKVGAWIFSLVKDPPNELSIEHLAAIETNGTQLDNKSTPYQIIFVASDQVANIISPNSDRDFREDLADIKAGTTIYQVMAKASPDDESELIANVVLTSDFKMSRYGDKSLFFQHHK